MPRVGKDLAHRGDLDQPPRIHHAHHVGELRHQPHAMADQNDGCADVLLRMDQGLHNLLLHDHFERAGRLVGQDDLRRQDDGDASVASGARACLW